MTVPVAAALVLRDRTNADHLHVLALALDALLADGTWATGRAWRRLRRVPVLTARGGGRPGDRQAARRPSARDDETRAAALKALSPPARTFLKAYRNALGSDLPKSGLPTGGDNREAAWRTGTGI